MNKRYENAKKQGLNWQAILIEETQTEIKVLIQKMILDGKSFYEINKKIVEIINKIVEDLESEELKESSKSALYVFATRTYNYLKYTYQGLNWFGLLALKMVAENNATAQQIEFVEKLAGDTAYNKAVPLELFSKEYIISFFFYQKSIH